MADLLRHAGQFAHEFPSISSILLSFPSLATYHQHLGTTKSAMKFDDTTVSLLKKYSYGSGGSTGIDWYTAWNAILNALFPTSKGFMVQPWSRCSADYTVHKVHQEPTRLRITIVLKVYIRNKHVWPHDARGLSRLIDREMQTAYKDTMKDVVYWIAAIGQHWQYGKKLNERKHGLEADTTIPLIDWQHKCHTQAAYRHFSDLAEAVENIFSDQPPSSPTASSASRHVSDEEEEEMEEMEEKEEKEEGDDDDEE